MRYTNEKIEFEIDRVVRKWKPIADALKIEDTAYVELISLYAENYRHGQPSPIIEEKPKAEPIISAEELERRLKIDPFGEEIWDPVLPKLYENKKIGIFDESYLPFGLKILSKLNLDDKNVVLTSSPEHTQTIPFSVNINRQQVDDLRFAGMDFIRRIDNEIMKNIENYINEKLKESDTFYLNNLVVSISNTIDDITMDPKITFYTSIGFR